MTALDSISVQYGVNKVYVEVQPLGSISVQYGVNKVYRGDSPGQYLSTIWCE